MTDVYFHNQYYKLNKEGTVLNSQAVEFHSIPRSGDWIEVDTLHLPSMELQVLKVIYYVDGLDNSWVNIVLDTDLTAQDFAGTPWADDSSD